MTQFHPHLPQIHLNPGELIVTQEPCVIVTLLGSCVAVTIHSARLKMAAMCHGMLPRPKGNSSLESDDGLKQRFRFLSEAIPTLIDPFRQAGASQSELVVKVFGGANVIPMDVQLAPERGLGNVNVQTTLELLASEGLLVKASNVGGTRGRKILFNTQTGQVLHKHLAVVKPMAKV